MALQSQGTRPGNANGSGSGNVGVEGTDAIRTVGRFKLRGKTDDLPQDWWFASTAIPLVAATIGPMANVLSIAALVSKWRDELPNNGQLPEGLDAKGVGIPDPKWVIVLNAISLVCGFFGNFCLLLNFTKRVRYIVALPLTIITWYMATGILIGIIVAMNQYVPPHRPGQTYSQGFWHAILAAIMYLIGSMILMVNMLGYFLGHYPQHFDLDDDQRTLILQTMMFFFWLAGGAAVFSKVCGFSYADALYFCDVTVLTVGFGDLVAPNDAGRGLVFPYSVIGIIFLGLMINSIRLFAISMSKDKVVKNHQQRARAKTFSQSITSEKELRERLGLPRRVSTASGSQRQSLGARRESLSQYGHISIHGRTVTFHEYKHPPGSAGRGGAGRSRAHGEDAKTQNRAARRSPRGQEKLILLKEEKDRFEAMREIQQRTTRFKQYYALSMSVFAFGVLWCIGALVFYYAEHRIQDMSYFEALYFCYVSLLTIGYGDYAPKSNAGKPLFIVWSLMAVPTMTILISDMSDTVIAAINRGTFTLADWTVMPKEGIWAELLNKYPAVKEWLLRRTTEREAERRIERGFALADPDIRDQEVDTGNGDAKELQGRGPSLEKLAEESPEVTEHDLARKLAVSIKKVSHDLKSSTSKKYSYEEWVEFTRLIRFSKGSSEDVEEEEEEEGLVEWDWIGEDSPMLADISESEWILDRLCESLDRYTKRQARKSKKQHLHNVLNLHHQKSSQDRDVEHYPAHPGRRFLNPISAQAPEGTWVARTYSKPPPGPEIGEERKMESPGGERKMRGSGSDSATAVDEAVP